MNLESKKMRERDNIIKILRDEVLDKLSDVAKDKKYPDLVRYLIVQGLMTITENKIILQCRKEDLNIVKGQLDAAIKLYQDFIKDNTGIVPKCSVDISNDFLPSGAVKGKKNNFLVLVVLYYPLVTVQLSVEIPLIVD